MKACQLCGANSWGPAPTAIDVHSSESYLVGRDLTEFRKCDACGAVACLKLLETTDAPREMHLPPSSPFDALQSVFATALPKPDSRTERILRALLTQGGMLKPPAEVVRYARELESCLDTPAPPVWVELRFADRAALETWLVAGLVATCMPEGSEKLVAHQFAQWVEVEHS